MSETWTLSELVGEAATRLEALPPPKNGQVRAVPDERTIRYYAALGLLDRPAAMRGRTALYDRKHLAQVVAIKRMQSAGHSLADIQRLWSTMDDTTLSRMSGVQVAGSRSRRSARSEFWKREPQPEQEAHAHPYRYSPPQPDPTMPHRTGSTPVRTTAASANPTTINVPLAKSASPTTLAESASPTTLAESASPTTLAESASPTTIAESASPTTINVPLDESVSIVIALSEDAAISLAPADIRALRAAAAPLLSELENRGLIAPSRSRLKEEP